jgi:peptidoglycan/LPS O-acetylase OafA/YrhL
MDAERSYQKGTASNPLRSRITALDGLRAFAITAVFIAHDDEHFFNGGLGVDVFFVLSGFLITTLIVTEHESAKDFRYGRFLARRALRLMPALIPVVIFAVLASFLLSGDIGPQTRSAAPLAILYVANWYRALGHQAGLLAHTWSLGVEEQFYLAWPLILGVAYRVRGRRGVMWTALMIAITSTAWRLGLSLSGASVSRIYNGTDTVADQLLIGAVIAMLVTEAPEQLRRAATLAPVALVALVVLMFSQVSDTILFDGGATFVAVCAALVISALVLRTHEPLATMFSRRPVVFLGRISYGLYLWHYPLLLVIRDKVPNVILCGVIAAIASIITASASFWLIEAPVMRWRQRRVGLPIEDNVAIDHVAEIV